MSGEYTGSYSRQPQDIFDLKGVDLNGIEAKRYLSTLVQASSGEKKFAWIDRDENERTFMIMNQLRRAIEVFIGDGTTYENDGFKVSAFEDENRQDNNFYIEGPNAVRMEDAGRYYIKGLPATILNDADLIPASDATQSEINNTKQITPKISSLQSTDPAGDQDRTIDIIEDVSADFPDNFIGKEVIPNIESPDQRYTVNDVVGNRTKLVVDVSSQPDLNSITGQGEHYRVVPSTPSSDRTDRVFLDVFLDEVGPEDDSSILHEVAQDVSNNESAAEIEGQRRIKLSQNILIREGNEPTPFDGQTEDNAGNQHVIEQLSFINRLNNDSKITPSMMEDTRNLIRQLSNLEFVNFISNSSFELDDFQGSLLDWEKVELPPASDNIDSTIDAVQNNAVQGNRSMKLEATNLPDSNDRVRAVQIIGDESAEEDLENTYRNQDITFLMDVKTDVSDVQLVIKVTGTDGSQHLRFSDAHPGGGNYERLELTATAIGQNLNSGEELDEIQFGVQLPNEGTLWADQAIAVYGEFTESVKFVSNVLADEIALIRDEVDEARDSDIYRSHSLSTNDDEWEHGSLDERIEYAEEEVVEARESNTLDFERDSLDERIEQYEDLFLQEHTQDGFHNPGVRRRDYGIVADFTFISGSDGWSSSEDPRTYTMRNRFSARVEESDINLQNEAHDYYWDEPYNPSNCNFLTWWAQRILPSVQRGNAGIYCWIEDEWGNIWADKAFSGGGTGSSSGFYACPREETPAGDKLDEGLLSPGDEFEMTYNVRIDWVEDFTTVNVAFKAEKVFPGVLVI